MHLADDQLHAGQTALYQTLAKLPSVRCVFANRHRDAQHGALAIITKAHGDQDRSVAHLSDDLHVLIARIQQQKATDV